jgi:hypothetical protein
VIYVARNTKHTEDTEAKKGICVRLAKREEELL